MTGFDITKILSRIENLYEEKERQLKNIQNDSRTLNCVKTQLAELKIREMWGIAQAIQQIHEYERIYHKELNNADKEAIK